MRFETAAIGQLEWIHIIVAAAEAVNRKEGVVDKKEKILYDMYHIISYEREKEWSKLWNLST